MKSRAVIDDDHRKVRARGPAASDRLFVLLERGRRQRRKRRHRQPMRFQRGFDRRKHVLDAHALAAADARDHHGFTQLHWVTGMAGRQACIEPTGDARDMCDAGEVAAERGVAGEKQRLHLQRHRIGDEPAAGAQGLDGGVQHAGIAAAAADEDRVGRVQPGKRLGR